MRLAKPEFSAFKPQLL